MSKDTKRGYVPEDEKEFKGNQLEKLQTAAEELLYLLDRKYQIKSSSTFIGNHYMFSERQRLALARAVSSSSDIKLRKEKQIKDSTTIQEVNMDGFNTIITLEVALSGSPLFECFDGSIRDLAGLRGTYRIIDKTEIAVELILKWLDIMLIQKANIYLDAPVSNSGRLKTLIEEKAEKFRVKINIKVINDVDKVLEKLPFVITSDAIILNKSQSWINMNKDIIGNEIKDVWCIKFTSKKEKPTYSVG